MLKVALRGVLARKFRLALTGTAVLLGMMFVTTTYFRFSIPVGRIAVLAVVSLVAGAVAAVIPAWRAWRLQVFEAIGPERETFTHPIAGGAAPV
jgi:ABC-type lipoprotein release transport system permease subunit